SYASILITGRNYIYERLDFFFFFQAEDGIRDFHVTGVQTCALPIWDIKKDMLRHLLEFMINLLTLYIKENKVKFLRLQTSIFLRSEERRVGKECRSRWSTYVEKNKEQYNVEDNELQWESDT